MININGIVCTSRGGQKCEYGSGGSRCDCIGGCGRLELLAWVLCFQFLERLGSLLCLLGLLLVLLLLQLLGFTVLFLLLAVVEHLLMRQCTGFVLCDCFLALLVLLLC